MTGWVFCAPPAPTCVMSRAWHTYSTGSTEWVLWGAFQHPVFTFKAWLDGSPKNSITNCKVMPKTLIRNQKRTLELSEKKMFLQGEQWLKANNNNTVMGKIYTFSSAERQHNCTVHTVGNRLQMKANLVSLCKWELQLDHSSLWNKDREKWRRKRKRTRAREGMRWWKGGIGELGGREKTRASWPTWANNSSEMRVWLKGPSCP